MKNVIFDVGNVLLGYDPAAWMATFYDQNTVDDLMGCVFQTHIWLELDQGLITNNDAILRMSAENPQYAEEIAYVMTHWTEQLVPVQANVDVMKALKADGYGVFILTNFHSQAYHHCETLFPFLAQADGAIVSADVKLLKPDTTIFKRLLDTYDLKAKECVYVDDLTDNIDAAKSLGMDGILYTGQDIIPELKDLGFAL